MMVALRVRNFKMRFVKRGISSPDNQPDVISAVAFPSLAEPGPMTATVSLLQAVHWEGGYPKLSV